MLIYPAQNQQGTESRDAAHEKRILDCYHRWLEGEAKWPELVALINARVV